MHNGKHSHAVATEPVIRINTHKRVQLSISLNPDVYTWLVRERAVNHLSLSEIINRHLHAQLDLRQQLSALPDANTDGKTPLFAVLLEQHGEKVSKTVGRAMKGIEEITDGLGVLEAMVRLFAEAAMPPPKLKEWEVGVENARGKR